VTEPGPKASVVPTPPASGADEASGGETSEEDLLRRWQAGDREAGGSLLAAQHVPVLRTCHRLGIHREDEIAEVYQELVVRLVRSLPRLRIERSFAGYVRRAVENTIADLKGGRPRPAPLAELPDAPDPRPAGPDLALREALERCRGKLSALEEAVYEHRFVLERDYEEIARLVGRTVNHVGVTVFRAVRKMRTCLEAAGFGFER